MQSLCSGPCTFLSGAHGSAHSQLVQPVVIWLVGDLLATASGTDGALVEVWIPKACAIGVALVWNFALYHLVVFPAVEDGEDG